MSRLKLSFLGTFQASLDERALTSFESNKARALLAYLAVEAERPHSRQALAALLWPDWTQQKALYYLRNTLSDLRRMLGDRQATSPFLLVSHDTLQFNLASNYWLDVAEFQRLSNPSTPKGLADPWGFVNLEECEQAVSLYQVEFLEGLSVESTPFEEWVLVKGELLHQLMLENLHRLTDFYLESASYEKAQKYAHKQVELEPWREEAYRQWMLALAKGGQRSEALAQYEACRSRLREELGVEPSAETQQLYKHIRDGEITPGTPQKTRFHNLPAQVTSFIGREKDIEQVKSLLEENRLVTLSGAGGAGKSRLALRVAEELLGNYPDGAWLVELAPLADPQMVPMIAARALGLGEQTSAQTLVLLQDYLENKRLLLILDNCEHLIEACAWLAEMLLASCPDLHLLITSREKLGIAGEVVFRVPSLSLPDLAGETYWDGKGLPDQILRLETLAQSEAVRLFSERAGTALPGFRLTSRNATLIAQVCVRLDGIPLAIELAAGRVPLLQVEEIARRLDDRFRLLTGGSRATLPRYQTLRASIDWSYALLLPAEQALLQRLSAFAGSWTLAAAEAACSGGGIEAGEILNLQAQLVSKSLVVVEVQPGVETRYRMLETIRQYAREKLAERGESGQMRQRHLQYYLELSEEVGKELRGPEQGKLLDLLEAELDNLRLALEWSLESEEQPAGSLEVGLRLATALRWFWHSRGRQYEGLQWLEWLLSAEAGVRRQASSESEKSLSPERAKVRAWALMVAGHLEYLLADLPRFYEYLEESRDLFLDLGLKGRLGYANVLLILSYLEAESDLSRATQLLKESLSIFQAAGDAVGMGQCYVFLGFVANLNEEYESAKTYLEKSLACHERIGDQDGMMGALYHLGDQAFRSGYDEQARILFVECNEIASEIHNVSFTHPRFMLGLLDWMVGKEALAAQRFERILSISLRAGHPFGILQGLDNLGWLALSQGDFRQAAKRFGEELDFFRKMGKKGYTAETLHALGYLAWAQGDTKLAITRYAEGLEICHENKDRSTEASILMGLGKVAIELGDLQQGRAHLMDALQNWQNIYPIWNCRFIFEALAHLGAVCEKWEQAACLLGFTEAAHQRFQRLRVPQEREMRENTILKVCAALGEEVFTAAWKEGEGMGVKQAVLYAESKIFTASVSASRSSGVL
jgi:predicted ATPase/DNA-binding SARP family transcriptional activator